MARGGFYKVFISHVRPLFHECLPCNIAIREVKSMRLWADAHTIDQTPTGFFRCPGKYSFHYCHSNFPHSGRMSCQFCLSKSRVDDVQDHIATLFRHPGGNLADRKNLHELRYSVSIQVSINMAELTSIYPSDPAIL